MIKGSSMRDANLVPYEFSVTGVTGTIASTAMGQPPVPVSGGGTVAGPSDYVMPADGWVIATEVETNTAVTGSGGTIAVVPALSALGSAGTPAVLTGAAATDLTATLSTASATLRATASATTKSQPGVNFLKGDRLNAFYSTTATLSSTNTVCVRIFVGFNVVVKGN